MSAKLDEAAFAKRTLRAYILYSALAKSEKSAEFRAILSELAETSQEQFRFWAKKSGIRGDEIAVSGLTIFRYRLMRKILGLTLTAEYILGRKRKRINDYKTYCKTCTVEEDYKTIEVFVQRMHAVVEGIEEDRVVFFSNIILGFNDALIAQTGALVGFSFALYDTKLIIIAGLITGISASLSMTASAFLQARHEDGKNPYRAAVFTGVSYLVIATLLTMPFVFIPHIYMALIAMGAVVSGLILLVSFYSAVILHRTYRSRFVEIFALSLGVAILTFSIGHGLSLLIGV